MRASLLLAVVLAGSSCGDDGGGGTRDAAPPDAAGLRGLPEELADEPALAEVEAFDELARLRAGFASLYSSYDRLVTAPPPLEILQNGNRDMNHFVCRGADAQQPGPVIIPYFYDQEGEVCPEPYVRGFVVARAEGSGRLARFWMTAFTWSRGASDNGELLRVWIDDDPTPRIEIPLIELRDGSGGPMVAPPFGAGSLERVAWTYPMVYGSKLVMAVDVLPAGDAIYHQTQLLHDDPAVPSRAAAPATLSGRAAFRDQLAYRALGAAPGPWLAYGAKILVPGEVLTIDEDPGPGTIRRLGLRIPTDKLAELETLRITATVDGTTTIDTTAALLFGVHRGVVPSQGPIIDARDLGSAMSLALRLPMPRASSMTWRITHGGSTEFQVELTREGVLGPPEPPWGHLHVQTHETVGPTENAAHPLIDVAGRGHLAGVCLDLAGHAWADGGVSSGALNMLEGDERFVVDGTDVLAGTGTEDYLGGAFYFAEGLLADPLASVWHVVADDDAEPPRGEITGCRWHGTVSPIPFTTGLVGELEIGPAQPSLLEHYRSVAYVYLAP